MQIDENWKNAFSCCINIKKSKPFCICFMLGSKKILSSILWSFACADAFHIFMRPFFRQQIHELFPCRIAHKSARDINIYIIEHWLWFLSFKTIMVIMIKYLCYAICFFVANEISVGRLSFHSFSFIAEKFFL